MKSIITREEILVSYGASGSDLDELLSYNHNCFDSGDLDSLPPLVPEPHVAAWTSYCQDAEEVGVFQSLQRRLPQLCFPIQAGISESQQYRAATRQGSPTQELSEATGLALECPKELQLALQTTLAGPIPVITTGCRADFVSLVQALTRRNEPIPIPESMGSLIISGYNNWDRIAQYRADWDQRRQAGDTWDAEFQTLKMQRHLYQDRFIILSNGAYSNVKAVTMGMTEAEWLVVSHQIRLEHECTHYCTRRLFNSMRNNLLDELIADYFGITAANKGVYQANWFLRFIGLEQYPKYRAGGRLENYRGETPLSDRAFQILQALVNDAAHNLEEFHNSQSVQLQDPMIKVAVLVTLTPFTMEDLAASEAQHLLNQQFEKVLNKMSRQKPTPH